MQQNYFILVALNQFLLNKMAKKKHFSKFRLFKSVSMKFRIKLETDKLIWLH